MNCEEGMELMQRYVDHDLNEEEHARLLEHIGQCPDCAAMFQRLADLSRGLEQLPRVAPPYSLVDAILPELSKIQPETGSAVTPSQSDLPEDTGQILKSRRLLRRNFRSWIPRISGAAALAAVIWLLFLNRPDADLLPAGNRQAAMPDAVQERAAADANSGMHSSADMQLFTAPGAGGSNSSAGSSPGSHPGGNEERLSGGMKESGGFSFNNEGLVSGEIGALDQYGSVQDKEFQVNPSAPAVSFTAEDGREDASFTESPMAGIASGESSSGRELPGEASSGEGSSGAAPSGEGLSGEGSSMSIMDFVPAEEEAVSPDGQWRAVITDGALQLYRMSDGTLVYDEAPNPCVGSSLLWSADSSFLQYTCTDAEGNPSLMELRILDSAPAEMGR